jgi:dihydroorotase
MASIIIQDITDLHFHPREYLMMHLVVPFTAAFCSRGVAMGNLANPSDTAEKILKHREEIIKISGPGFEPIPVLMLTKNTTIRTIREAYAAGIRAVKIMFAGSTNNATDVYISLPNLKHYYHLLEEMAKLGMQTLWHFELAHEPISGEEIPYRFREARAVPYAIDVIDTFPNLLVTIEHITTKEMVKVVDSAPNITYTITPQAMRLTYQDVFDENDEIAHPLNFCLPVAKTSEDRDCIIERAIYGGDERGFGSDSAPHWLVQKIKKPCKPGIFNAATGVYDVVETFVERGASNRLNGFFSDSADRRFGSPASPKKVELINNQWVVPHVYEGIPHYRGGEIIGWCAK